MQDTDMNRTTVVIFKTSPMYINNIFKSIPHLVCINMYYD